MKLLDQFSSLSLLFVFGSCVFQYRYLSSSLKLFFYLICFGIIVELSCAFMAFHHSNNIWLMNLYNLVEMYILTHLLGNWLDTKRWSRIALILFVLYFIYWLYSIVFLDGIMRFNSNEIAIKSALLIYLSGVILVKVSKNFLEKIFLNYQFWISSAILIYFAVNLVVFSTANFLLEQNDPVMHYTWDVHSIINVFTNLLYTFGMLCYYRKMKSSF